MKKYDIYIAGGTKIDTLRATCISKACKEFMQTLPKATKYKIITKEYATIRYVDNYSICSDYVVMEQ